MHILKPFLTEKARSLYHGRTRFSKLSDYEEIKKVLLGEELRRFLSGTRKQTKETWKSPEKGIFLLCESAQSDEM